MIETIKIKYDQLLTNAFHIVIFSLLINIFFIGDVLAQGKQHTPDVKFINAGYELTENEYLTAEKGISFIISRYTNTFGFYYDEDLAIKLRVFGDFYSFKIYQMGYSRSTTNCAFYSSKLNEAIVWRRKKHTTLMKDIYHEANHILFRNIKSSERSNFLMRPLWINEGLSEYFEYMSVGKEGIEVKIQTIKAKRCEEWIETGKMLSLKEYLLQDNKTWKKYQNKESGYQSRTMAWSLVYFMMENDERQKMLGNIIRHIEQRQYRPIASYNAVQRYYPGGVSQLEKDWHVWITSNVQTHKYSPPITFLPNIDKKTPVHFPVSNGM